MFVNNIYIIGIPPNRGTFGQNSGKTWAKVEEKLGRSAKKTPMCQNRALELTAKG